MIIVDGYNLIHASESLQPLAREDLEAAREQLIEVLIEYSARQELEVELVFDAASRGGPARSESRSKYLKVTFTAGGKTADSYIESLAYRLERIEHGSVRVVTGDYHQQKVAGGAGLLRVSSREFLEEMRDAREQESRERGRTATRPFRVRMDKRLPDDIREALLRLRERRK